MERRLIAESGSWEDMRRSFQWPNMSRFNMGCACCDDWAAVAPDRQAVTHIDAGGATRSLSFGELKSASDRFASVLAQAGLGRGDRLAIFLPQCPEVLIAHIAAWKLGAITLPLFTLFGPDALTFRLADSGAKIVLCDADGAGKLDAIATDLPDLAQVIVTGSAPGEMASLIEAASPLEEICVTSPDDPAVLIYTSGTTGPPKGALHAHRFLIGHLPSFELHHPGAPASGDVGWTPADWAWIGGLMDLAMPCLYYGIPLVSHRFGKFDAGAAYDLMRRHKVTRAFLPPTALRLLRAAPEPAGLCLRSVGSGGESLGSDLLDWGGHVLGAPINEFYGQTECNLVLTASSACGAVPPGSMGRAVPGHEVAVIGPDGTLLPDGEVGEIAVRAPDPAMFLRYWNAPEKTAGKFIGDWMRTGDLGRRDAGGFFFYVSRDDDVITSAGYRIGPTEIESCLAGHPDVVMAAVVGVPDPVRTEIVKAYVVLREGRALSEIHDALIARVRERVSAHVAPREIEAVESLPMTATGKIMRRALRDRN